jgi:hypothetical protein
MSALTDKQERFVTEFMKDGAASAAAVRAGFSARTAARLMAMAPIKDEIALRRTAAVAETGISVKSLIEEAEAARKVAEQDGNAAGMTAAITLKARLSGQLDAEPPPPPPAVNTDPHSLALAIVDLLRQAGHTTGRRVVFAEKGETLVRVSDPEAAKLPAAKS